MNLTNGDTISKLAELTEKGVVYCKKSIELKEKIEEEISKIIGIENLMLIKEIINKDWIIDSDKEK